MNVSVPSPLKVMQELARPVGQVLLAGILVTAGILVMMWMLLVFLAGWIAGALLVSAVLLRILARSIRLRWSQTWTKI